ncbi:MAG: FAD-dependent oxidoreductase [Syntrophomonadaceae bacterium]|jgi:heterodisulfide reductase subunit A|nr:FAD-dependent oxidoreductase [Syntrophomonadaceae bacterium]MDH7498581.1 FAD-dependent oxidoreductase [Syntrophomonadaceae bacterium]
MEGTAQTALVVGGGPAGIEAAIKIGVCGHRAVLVEREQELGGYLRGLARLFPSRVDPGALLQATLAQLQRLPTVSVMTGSQVSTIQRQGPAFVARIERGDAPAVSVDAGALVLATGFDYFDVSRYGEYGHGFYPGVVNSLEFESLLARWAAGQGLAEAPAAVAFFKCVGSRDRAKGHPFCSKICCLYTAKQAAMFKELFPSGKAFVFYMDVRAAGKGCEEFVRDAIEDKGVRYIRGRPAKVLPEGPRLQIRAEDTLIGTPIEAEVDMVVLAGAAVPRPETRRLCAMLEVRTDEYGFLQSEPGQPVVAGEGVFFAGGCGFPADLQQVQEQGAAAAAEVVARFASRAQR